MDRERPVQDAMIYTDDYISGIIFVKEAYLCNPGDTGDTVLVVVTDTFSNVWVRGNVFDGVGSFETVVRVL